MAILWALACLFCAAFNDFLFKLYKRKQSSTGAFTTLIGLVWLGILLITGGGGGIDSNSFFPGLVSGFFSIAANLLLITSMRYQSAGVSSTIYRLNLGAVAFGAWVLFGEQLNLRQFLGFLIAVGAVLCFFPWKEKAAGASRFGLLLALSAALLRGAMALVYKQAFLNACSSDGILFWNSLCWIIGGIVWHLAVERRKKILSARLSGYGICSGILVFGIVFTMAEALTCGNANIVIPIAQMSFIITFLLGGVLLGEHFDRMKIAGAGLGFFGVLLLSCA